MIANHCVKEDTKRHRKKKAERKVSCESPLKFIDMKSYEIQRFKMHVNLTENCHIGDNFFQFA